MSRYIHIVGEVLAFLVSITSRAFNALGYKGSIYQTFSARCHIEGRRGSVEWQRRERYVNKLFFWADDHCKDAWEAEVIRARETLAQNQAN